MKLYDYQCNSCGHRFEAMVEEGWRPPCEACTTDNVRRLVCAPAVKRLGGLDRAVTKQEMRRESIKNQEEKAMNPRSRPKGHWTK